MFKDNLGKATASAKGGGKAIASAKGGGKKCKDPACVPAGTVAGDDVVIPGHMNFFLPMPFHSPVIASIVVASAHAVPQV